MALAHTMSWPAHPFLLLQRRPSSPPTAEPRVDDQAREAAGARLACHRCLLTVTDGSRRIAVGGAHAHHLVNPHGIEFDVGCFADAHGCATVGAASTYWSWFPGFAWQVEVCAQCGEHLGWLFVSPDALFHGLILDRLVEVAMD
jgi:hypothetical protein